MSKSRKPPPSQSLLTNARASFHFALLTGPLTTDKLGLVSIADKSNPTSREVSSGLVSRMGIGTVGAKAAGQTSGKVFEQIVATFLRASFLKLGHIRPGTWEVRDRTSSQNEGVEISNFEQYQHLSRLMKLITEDKSLAADLGSDYLITPDVVVLRRPESDDYLNQPEKVVDDSQALLSPLRRRNLATERMLLHASVSCKWTLRSDRAQNARSEALNLIRNRKGRVPHIAAVTAEPVPSRIASLALGTSDLDCVYHIALPELRLAIADVRRSSIRDQIDMLDSLVDGRRLRDIADLPLDLAI